MEPARLELRWTDARGEARAAAVARALKVGRAPECDLVLDEEGVSRVHCELRPEGATLLLLDLDSTNGTWVNGAKVREARLQPGDRVVLGRLALRVAGGEALAARGESFATHAVDTSDVEYALDAASAGYPPAHLPHETGARHLQALYGILRAIGDAADGATMLRRALEVILDALPLDFGHVLIGPARGGADALEAAASCDRSRATAPPWSRTVVRRVAATGESVLANDVQAEPELKAAKSLAAARTLRIGCAPVPLRGRLGVLYVAARGLASPLLPEDAAFLAAAARQIGLAADALAERETLARDNERLREASPARRLAGSSAAMQRVRELVGRAAQVDATVLIAGESGTGKELVARGIHEASARAGGRFVALNCGALPSSVVASELFGHERGAFTGATARRVGLVELAHRGTLFLDEVGELAPDVQAMLLRLLEERRFRRVGGSEEVVVDLRFVAATHRDLAADVRAGRFRADLLFRLEVIGIATPPLRERPEDLPELAAALLEELARGSGRVAKEIAPEALERLRHHRWPGNVRELRNALERGLLLSSGPRIEAEALGLPAAAAAGAAAAPGALLSLAELERDHVRRVLDATGWNKTRAAEILGIARITLYEKIRAFRLEPPG